MNNKKLFSVDDAEKLSSSEIINLTKNYINNHQANIFSKFSWGSDLFEKAEGMYIYTKNDKKILDFTGGIGVLNLGHNHPRILKKRIEFQKKNRMEIHKLVFSPYLAALSKNLSNLLPGDLNKTFMCNSGAEAVEGAMKLAYKYYKGKRKIILHSDISYHGRLIASGSISGSENYEKYFPKIPNTDFFKYNDIESLEKKIKENIDENNNCNIYAIIFETYSASAVIGLNDNFINYLRKICKKYNIIMIADEVYTGWGKTGYLFNFNRFNEFIPDIVTTSKGIGGGKASISAFIARDEIFEKSYSKVNEAFLHTSTYNGFGEECATAIEVINTIIDEKLVDNANFFHKNFLILMNNLKDKYPSIIKTINGSGCLNGVSIKSPLESIEKIFSEIPINFIKDRKNFFNKVTTIAICNALYDKHNIFCTIRENGNNVYLSVSPSLIVKKEELEYFVNSLDNIFSSGLISHISKFYLQVIKKIFFSK